MKKRTLLPILLATTVMGTSMTAFAATPMYKPLSEYGYTGVPNIKVTLPDSTKNAINNAVDEAVKDLDIKFLTTPTITECRYIHSYGYYYPSRLQIRWGEVEDATSYEIIIKKTNGTERTYTSNYNSLIVNEGEDDFITCCVMGGTVKVRAVKGNGSLYSLWTEENTIACNRLFH